MGHWRTCILDFQQLIFVQLTLELHSGFVWLPPQAQMLHPATAAAVVQSRLHEPCSVYYFASVYVRQTVSCSFVLPYSTRSRRRHCWNPLVYKMRCKLEMWANAQRDGRPAEYTWRPLFNAAKFG